MWIAKKPSDLVTVDQRTLELVGKRSISVRLDNQLGLTIYVTR